MKAIFVAVSVIIVAIAIEFYKKVIRGTKDAEGNPKTAAKAWEVYCVAAVCSIPWGYGCALLTGGKTWYIGLLWTIAIYAMQYIVDMTLVKKTVNGLLKRLG